MKNRDWESIERHAKHCITHHDACDCIEWKRHKELVEWQNKFNRLQEAMTKEHNEVEQILGKALGYPYGDYKICSKCDTTDCSNCPDPFVVVGDHTPATLAMEAASRIADLEARLGIEKYFNYDIAIKRLTFPYK
jgi:hypothetical protein